MKFKHPEAVKTWPQPNYIDPETRGPELYIVNGVFFGLASLAVTIRLCTRIFVRKWFGLDDAFILIAWICGMGDMATVFWGYHRYWWDRHMWDGKQEFLVPGAKAVFVAKLFWITTSTCVRLSLHVLYYRLLNHLDMRKYRWAVHCSVFVVLGIYSAHVGCIVFACVPIEQYFAWPPNGTCIDESVVNTILSASNTLSEAVTAALPIPIVMRLGMLSTERLGVLCLLSAGFFVSAVGTVRTFYVWETFAHDDLTWWAGPHWICSEVEISVAMICACMPAIRPLITRLLNLGQPISRAIRQGQSSLRDRKSSVVVTRSSIDYSVTSYDPWSRKVDVEGIGVDGYGYTVTVTGGEPGRSKSKKLRKLSCPDRQSSPGDMDSQTDLRVTSRPWYGGSSRPSVKGWGSTHDSDKEKGIEIVTRQSFEVVEEPVVTNVGKHRLPTVSCRSVSRNNTERHGISQAESPQAFYHETDKHDWQF